MPGFDWGPLLQGSGPFCIGILNLTPDSFSDGGRFLDPEAALRQGRALAAAGAGMLDLGAESTRPGAAPVDGEEEWRRLEPVLGLLRSELPDLPLSVDTRRAATAARALAGGAAVLNDVGGFADPAMRALAGGCSCGLIAMRSRCLAGTLWMPPYDGPAVGGAGPLVEELRAVRLRLLEAGLDPGRILLDPGFGFGTTYSEDLALWEALPGLPAGLDWPVARFCLGVSRKRFVARRFGGGPQQPPADRDAATARAHQQALGWGFRVFRSHAV